jgi:hypothetical protein
MQPADAEMLGAGLTLGMKEFHQTAANPALELGAAGVYSFTASN